jgi:hypothetical protein
MPERTGADVLWAFERTHLERIKLAAEVILELGDAISNALEVDLIILKDRVERALLLPDHHSDGE